MEDLSLDAVCACKPLMGMHCVQLVHFHLCIPDYTVIVSSSGSVGYCLSALPCCNQLQHDLNDIEIVSACNVWRRRVIKQLYNFPRFDTVRCPSGPRNYTKYRISLLIDSFPSSLCLTYVSRDELAMTALSARAWPLGAAWSKAILLACVLFALTANVAAQNVQTTAVPPSFAIQPLYGELLHQQFLHTLMWPQKQQLSAQAAGRKMQNASRDSSQELMTG
jgi:hypothetical protein